MISNSSMEPNPPLPAYTSTEKLLADLVLDALKSLQEAHTVARALDLKGSQDQSLVYIDRFIDRALIGGIDPETYCRAILNAELCSHRVAMPAWTGFPEPETHQPEKGDQQ